MIFCKVPNGARLFLAQARHMNADLLVGIAPIIDGKEYNSALLINAQGQVGGLYHKQALVPFAETTPLAAWGIDWGRGYHFSSGNKPGIFELEPQAFAFRGRDLFRIRTSFHGASAAPGRGKIFSGDF